jgi:hypothetical protein
MKRCFIRNGVIIGSLLRDIAPGGTTGDKTTLTDAGLVVFPSKKNKVLGYLHCKIFF